MVARQRPKTRPEIIQAYPVFQKGAVAIRDAPSGMPWTQRA